MKSWWKFRKRFHDGNWSWRSSFSFFLFTREIVNLRVSPERIFTRFILRTVSIIPPLNVFLASTPYYVTRKLFQLNFQTFRLLLTIKQATNNKKPVLWTTDLIKKKSSGFRIQNFPTSQSLLDHPKSPCVTPFPRQKEVDLNRRRRRQKVSSYELSLSGPATFQPWNTPHLETFITSVDHRWLKAFPLEPRDERPRLFRECISFLPLFLHPLFALYLSRGWSSPPPNIHETVMKISRGGKRSVSKLFA